MNRLTYTGGDLDHAAAMRRDDVLLAALREHPESRFYPFWRDRSLIAGLAERRPRAAWLDNGTAASGPRGEAIFLGVDAGGRGHFACDLPPDEEVAAPVAGAEWVDLRRVGASLAADEAARLAQARGLLYWHRHHRYCGRCGSPTEIAEGGHMRRCRNEACGEKGFPRVDPAVIMLVTHHPEGGEPRCLLAQHHRLGPGLYTTLAGFVVPGETLEAAVAREVQEEAGVEVGGVRYLGSQPWPFPASLMVGFTAEATSAAITIERHELAAARWFTGDEVRACGEWGEEGYRFALPRRDSIARWLVEGWLGSL